MRIVVIGPGAVGGTIAVRLADCGLDVEVVARGPHLAAIQRDGLELRDPGGSRVARVRAVGRPDEVEWGDDHVVLLAVKCQDTPGVLAQLADVAPVELPVVSVQNGVTNELDALRLFSNVHGVVVMCPTVHLRPGVVIAHSHPIPGILDVGRFPAGHDDTTLAVAAALRRAGFESRAIDDLPRWRWAKLVTNLGNAVEAVCGPAARAGPLGELVTDEGHAVLGAAAIDYATPGEDRRRRGDLLSLHPVGGERRPGGSTWQSIARGTAPETDLLNGEIVRLARLHGVAAPVNALLQRLVRRLAVAGGAPGSVPVADVLAALDGQGRS